jgi:RND superfamily putative drug exporter
MELLGDRNWWFPRWLDRLIPRLHVEAIPVPAPPAPPDEVSPPREPVPV